MVLFCFFGPCLMWVPFAMDNCCAPPPPLPARPPGALPRPNSGACRADQQPHGRPVHGGARPQLTVTTMAAQPVMAQPVMATAVPAVRAARALPQPCGLA